MPNRRPVVVIDPGHGGSEKIGGSSPNNAAGANGLLEKNLTLDIAQRMAGVLKDSARVLLTRNDDVNLSLTARADLARRNDAAIFLSLHFNGFKDQNVDGAETFVASRAGSASERLARHVLDHLVGVTRGANRGVKRADLGVLLPDRHLPQTAACLAEIAFLTNPAQARNLEDTAYRQRIAAALGEAILKCLSASPFSLQSLSFDHGNGHSDSRYLQPLDHYALGGSPTFDIRGSVGQGGANKPDDIFAVKQRLIELGYDWITPDKKMDAATIQAIRLFQSIVNDSKTLSGDGKIEVGKNTYKWLQAVNAPQWRKMPKGSAGEGFVNFEYDDENIHIYGTDWLADTIAGAGIHYRDNYLKSHPTAALLTVNDASLARGGNAPPHSEHQTGMDCDLRLPRTDGKTGGINIGKPAELLLFDRNSARAILQALKAQPLVSRLLFNDQTLIDEGLCKKSTPDHNHHIHVDISPPARGAAELNDMKHYHSGGRLYQGSYQDDIDYQSHTLDACGNSSAIAADQKYVEFGNTPIRSDRKNNKENVFLRWNNIPKGTCEIDVVVHFHGWNITGEKQFFDYAVRNSGLDLKDPGGKYVRQDRPTLCILPFGKNEPDYELKGEKKRHPGRYVFPVSSSEAGLRELINFSLDSLAKKGTFKLRRLILTAHSGGGAAVSKILALNKQPVDEVHLFDSTYGNQQSFIDWAEKKIKADSKLPASDLRTKGGALRVLYLPLYSEDGKPCVKSETAGGSEQIAGKLNEFTKQNSYLRICYRVEPVGIEHLDIPKTFGYQLLENVYANLTLPEKVSVHPCCKKDPKRCGVKEPIQQQSLGLEYDDDFFEMAAEAGTLGGVTAVAQAPPPAPPPAVSGWPLGVDLYSGNLIDAAGFQNLKSKGKVFAILKSSQGRQPDGRFQPDGKFREYFSDYYRFARESGMLRGSYHFFSNRRSASPVYGGSIAEQANTVLSLVKRLTPGDLAPALDLEDEPRNPANGKPMRAADGGRFPLDQGRQASEQGYRYRHIAANPDLGRAGRQELLTDIQDFLDRIETALGRTPMIYTSHMWSDSDMMNNPQVMSQYPLWTVYHGQPDLARITVGAWGNNWDFIQYAEQGGKWWGVNPYKEPGIDLAGLDFDAYKGTIYGLRGLADLGRASVALTPHGAFVAHSEVNEHIHLLYQGSPNAWTSADLMDGALPSLGGDPALLAAGSALHLYFRSDGRVVEAVRSSPSANWDATDLSSVARVPAVHDPRVVFANQQRFVVFSGDDDDWHLLTRNASGNWAVTHLLFEARRSVRTHIPPSSGQPNIYFVSSSPHPRIVGRAGALGHLFEVALGQTGWEATDLTAASKGPSGTPPAATYSPAIYQTATDTFIVYRAVRGQLWQIARNARTATNISAAASSRVPAAGHPACFVLDRRVHVVYRGVDRGIYELSFDGVTWRARSLPCQTPAASDPACTTDGRSALVAYRAVDGVVHVARFDGSAWTCGATVRSQPAAKPDVIATRGNPARPKRSTASAVELRLEDPREAKEKATNFRAIRCEANRQLKAQWEKVKQEMVRIATQEFQATWNNGTRQETEAAMKQIIRKYWRDGVLPGEALPAGLAIPAESWSAAFIAWVVKEAGGGDRFSRVHDEAKFRLNFRPQAHWRYVAPALINKTKLSQINPFWAYAIDAVTPQVGDIVVKSRGGSGLTLNQLATLTGKASDGQVGWLSHGDIVVQLDPEHNEIRIIGGNLGGTVQRTTVRLNASGFVQSTGGANNDHLAIVRINTGQYDLPECV